MNQEKKLIMIDLNLTPEQLQLQKRASDFGENVIKPIVKKIDDSNTIDLFPWDFCQDIFYQGAELGLISLLLPFEYGGTARKCIDFVLVQEELGAADVSIACSYFNLTAAMLLFVVRAGTSEQKRRILSHVTSGKPLLFSAAESEPAIWRSQIREAVRYF